MAAVTSPWSLIVLVWCCAGTFRCWHLVPGAGYYLYDGRPASWRDAQDACAGLDSALATPASGRQLKALGHLLDRHGEAYAHLGFHQLYRQGQFVTVYGEPIKNDSGRLRWEKGAPLAGPTYGCGAVSRGGELAVFECDQQLPFVCENKVWSDYEYFKGLGYYQLYTGGRNWADALERCAADGAHLSVLDSPEEAKVVKMLLGRFPTLNNTDHDDRALLGYHALFTTARTNPRIQTVLGRSLNHTGYNTWKRGQPALGVDWHCGAMDRQAELLMVSCSHKYAFVCEHQL